jgi:hypothetical protein
MLRCKTISAHKPLMLSIANIIANFTPGAARKFVIPKSRRTLSSFLDETIYHLGGRMHVIQKIISAF